MKTTLFLVLVMLISGIFPVNLEAAGTLHTQYGIELNQFVTGSGFGTATELSLSVIPDPNKQLNLGLFIDPATMKINGIIAHHAIGLFSVQTRLITRIRTYAFYNMIFRRVVMHEVLENKNITGDRVTYASMEHHIGLGNRVYLGSRIFITTEAGYGIYLGSIKKPSAPDPVTGEIRGTNGFGFIGKFGLGIIF